MDPKDGRRVNRLVISLVCSACILAALSCNLGFVGNTPAPGSPTVAVPASDTVEQIIPPPTAPNVPTATLEADEPVGLSQEGPWFVTATTEGMWILNSDGSGMTWIDTGDLYLPPDFASTAAPLGGHLAVLTASDVNRPHDLTLHLVTLPSMEILALTPLISPQYQPAQDAMAGDSAFEAMRAITDLNNLAWAPDGMHLAFMGIVEGPTSDLYAYSLDSGRISWLTDGPSHGVRPGWSPGGTYIVHQGVESLGTGAGYSMAGVWAARADGAGITRLYDVSEYSGDEKVLGWLDDATVVVYSWDPVCETKDLRSVTIGGEVESLWSGYFSDAALDPVTGTFLISVPDPMASCNGDGVQGLFLWNVQNSLNTSVSDANIYQVEWSEAMNAFFAVVEGGQVLLVDLTGQSSSLPAAYFRAPDVDPLSKSWAIANAVSSRGEMGVWVGQPGETPQKIFDQPAGDLSWSPEGGVLLFFGEMGLYAAHAPAYEPVLRGPGIQLTGGRGSAWVKP